MEISHNSGMFRERKEEFLNFVKEMYAKKQKYLELVNSFYGSEYHTESIRIKFYELDRDTYRYDVFKWLVTLEPIQGVKDTFEFSGYNKKYLYELIKIGTDTIIFGGNDHAVEMYINFNEEFSMLTQGEFDEKYSIVPKVVNMIEEWVRSEESFKDIELIFIPDENE